MITGFAAVFFYLFAVIMIVAAIMVIAARNPVHSVLFLILVFFNASGLFLLGGAEFLAMILLMVYVGAVAVLFLFVVMMLDVDFAELKRGMGRYAPIGGLVGLIVLAELIFVFMSVHFSPAGPDAAVTQPVPAALPRSNTQALGDILYTDYVFYFELAGFILLTAMIGAIVLALHHRSGVKRQSVGEQVKRNPQTAIEVKKVESGKGI
ncbi:MAG: NADH-quinone oxidoreductase subunit J [Candidatus Tokpelaia sp.]|uniref:NADH-quinone oxidoreductase subunit J n=1 Tax=Candidatus Tokpelaia sp. TaxID=2233777 RepID=UPI0012389566|nr:NADH-quinone oxidoreductase subunit J [Candidatus Tokpelaia sp.]KAA6205566.1 MAG: NADH-quinone oxidoreductase subunit J [Candidatus Tokpelaia sp.]KAA6207517.1 MAG: NADH-quinone oxidoreductase subunit J [Candidatus Tokpelaia sp.]KAA6404687.1 NADH-quinone oxidoreductase subunit J [Candidatus Tokpelaia sp.]